MSLSCPYYLKIYQEMCIWTVDSGMLLTVQILDTAGMTEAPAELQALGGKSGGRLTKPVSAELVICRRRLGSD